MMGNARAPSSTMVGHPRASADRGSASDNGPTSDDGSAATTVVSASAAILIIRITIAAGRTISAAYNRAASNDGSPANRYCTTAFNRSASVN
jgi:hypothetical protein